MNPPNAYRWSDLPKLIVLAVSYALIVLITLNYLSTDEKIPVAWLPGGLGAAALLIGGRKYWPAIFIGAMAVYVSVGPPWIPSFFIAVSNVVEPLILVGLLSRCRKFDRNLRKPYDYLWLLILGAVSAAVAAFIAVSALFFNGIIPAGAFLHTVMSWGMGNLLGIALITPLLLVWQTFPSKWFRSRARQIEAVIFFVSAVITCEMVFGRGLYGFLPDVPRGYLIFIFVAWGALHFGRRATTLVILLAAIYGLHGAIDNHGFFAGDIEKTGLTNFWLYMMTLGFVGVSLATSISVRRRNEETIQLQAHYDELTKLPNRRLFYDRLGQSLLKAQRDADSLTLMLIDLDRFKEVNDTLGHDAGDVLLVEAAHRINRCVRESDTVARMGGDEFVVILNGMGESVRIERIAQNIIDGLSEPFMLGAEQAYITASIGITIYPNDAATDIDTLLKNADQAMYMSKDLGRNRFSYFTEQLQQSAQKRLQLTNDLRSALKDNQFHLYYQPIIEMATGEVHKAEALIRWQHPTRGLISPVEFIPLAEENGMVNQIGDWVFRRAISQCKQWRLSHNASFQISVNKSPVQFHGNDKYSLGWLALMQEIGLSGKGISIEITEGLLLDVGSAVHDKLRAFQEAGVQIAIDDFGTGYSSLAYLKKFDIDNLKIDKSFVRNLEQGTDDLALCEAIIVMAHKLGLKVIAEGVETAGQRDLLMRVGCDYAQGYLFSKPLPADEFEVFLQGRTACAH